MITKFYLDKSYAVSKKMLEAVVVVITPEHLKLKLSNKESAKPLVSLALLLLSYIGYSNSPHAWMKSGYSAFVKSRLREI